jgi:alkaline phosphatase D
VSPVDLARPINGTRLHPWIHTFDDHEVENNWAGDLSQADTEPDQDPVVFRARRAQAFQAMYENLALRHEQMPSGADIRYHRRLPYGRLADFTILDTRQYRRSPVAATGRTPPTRVSGSWRPTRT